MLSSLLFTLLALAGTPAENAQHQAIPLTHTQLERLRQTQLGTSAQEALIRELETHLRLEPMGTFENHGLLVALEANFDRQPGLEMAVLMGRHERQALLLFVDHQGNVQSQIPVHNWYGSPEMMLTHIGPEKTLVVSQVEEHGTGIYRDSHHFYQWRQGQLHPVLRLPREARLYDTSDLNQHLHVRWKAGTGQENALQVSYQWRFFPGQGVPQPPSPHWAWLEGNEELVFSWDSQTQRYQPEFLTPLLNPAKLISLEDLGNQQGFFQAFAPELKTRWNQASALEKKYMQSLGWQPNLP